MNSEYQGDIVLRISILGPLDVTDGSGNPILLKGRKTRALLGILGLAAPRPIQRDALVGLLWSSKCRVQGDASLRQCVVEMHKSLLSMGPDVLKTGGGRLALSDKGLWVDASTLARATGARPRALRLLRGNLLEGFDGLDPALDRWLDTERQRLAATVRRLAESQLESLAEATERVSVARQLLHIDPANEVGWRAIIASHVETGEHTAAIEAYEQCCAAMAELNQTLPSFQTEALMKQISAGKNISRRSPSLTMQAGHIRSKDYAIRLGIMPLRGLDRESKDFAEGLVEEITTALGRFRGLSPMLTANMTAAPRELKEWRALNLDSVLDGSVQSSGGRMRVVIRLLDAHCAGEVVWTQRFDLELTDILTFRDEIASRIVAQIDPALMTREGYYAAAQRPNDATAYHLLLCAIPAIHNLNRAEFMKAGKLLSRAIELDPEYAPVHAWSAYWYLLLIGQGWAKNSETIGNHLQDLTERAVSLDPNDARALTLAGHVKAFFGHLGDASKLHERALSINPHLPLAWLFSGLAHTYLGQHEEAIRRIERAKELSPLDPLEFFFEMGLALSFLLRGEFETSVDCGRKALKLNPSFSSTCKCFLSALGYAGGSVERAEVLARLLALEPGFTVQNALNRSPLSRLDDRELYAEGLRRAGLPD